MWILHGKHNGVRLIETSDWEAREEVAKVLGMKADELTFSYSKIRIPLSEYSQEDFDIYSYIAEKWGIDDYDELAIYLMSPKVGYNHPIDAYGTVVTYFADKKSGNKYPVSEIELNEALDIIKNSSTDNIYDDTFIQFITEDWRLTDENRCETVTGMSSKELLDVLRYKYKIVDIYDDVNEPGHFDYLITCLPHIYYNIAMTESILDIFHILSRYTMYYNLKPFELYEILDDACKELYSVPLKEILDDMVDGEEKVAKSFIHWYKGKDLQNIPQNVAERKVDIMG